MADTLTVDDARAKLAHKLSEVVKSLNPVAQRGAVTRSNGAVLYTYALDIDELEPIRAALAAKGLHLASDVDPEHFHHFEREIEKSGQSGSYTVWEYKVSLFERTVITDGETGAQLSYLHPGMAIDDDPANACKQAQTSARRSMFRGVFNVVIDDSSKAKAGAGGRTSSASTGNGAAKPAKQPAMEGQERTIRTYALARNIALDSQQLADLVKQASNGYAKGPTADQGLSFKDAEALIKLLGAIPLPVSPTGGLSLDQKPVEAAAPARSPEGDDNETVDVWPDNVSYEQVEKLNAQLESQLIDGSDIDALVVEVSKHRTGELSELSGDEIDMLIAKLRQTVAKRKAGTAA